MLPSCMERISGCTAVIQSGKWKGQRLESALNNRGIAYDTKGDHDRAIADYDEAIRVNPKFAFAFNNRGTAYKNKGDPDSAIADYNEAIRLDPKTCHGIPQPRLCLLSEW
jgi:tetratricopeptide (TPR) repeat protein